MADTIPGGAYIVNHKWVDAEGRPLKRSQVNAYKALQAQDRSKSAMNPEDAEAIEDVEEPKSKDAPDVEPEPKTPGDVANFKQAGPELYASIPAAKAAPSDEDEADDDKKKSKTVKRGH